MIRWKGAAVTAAALALVVPPTAASADGGYGGHDGNDRPDDAVTAFAQGLEGPRQLDEYRGNRLVVAESDSAQISSVDLDDGTVELLHEFAMPAAPQGVGYDDGELFVALGEVGGPELGPPPAITLPPAGTPVPGCTETSEQPAGPALVVLRDGGIVAACDLLQYELVVNPDGQAQVDAANVPVDSLSNPYAVLVQKGRILVADAGANAVLSIDRYTGEISTFFVPPRVTGAPCEEAENNPGTENSCDPVPTGIAEGPDGLLYVSTLGGLTPGAGRVYVLDPHGYEVHRIEGLNPMTGIEVDWHGTVYVSELFDEQVFEGPQSLDPANPPGRIVRIERDGDRSSVPVVLPQGLEFEDGSLYASAQSLIPAAGQVVDVGLDAFAPLP